MNVKYTLFFHGLCLTIACIVQLRAQTLDPITAFAAAPKILELSPAQGIYTANSYLEILEDSSGALTFADVRSIRYNQAFRPFTGTRDPNFGYTPSVYWARLRVRVSAWESKHQAHNNWFLSVEYPHLDNTQLFVPSVPQAEADTIPVQNDSIHYEMLQSGDMFPFSMRALEYRIPNFRLPEQGNWAYIVYLRIQSQSSISFPIMIRSTDAMNSHISNEQFVLGMFYGILMIMVCYNALMYFFLRDISYWYYVLYIIAYGMFLLDWSGLSLQYFWPDSPIWHNYSMPLFIALSALITMRFTKVYLELPRLMPKTHLVLSWFEVYFVAGVALAFILPYAQAVKMLYAGIIITIPCVVVVSFIIMRKGYRPARYFFIGWILFLSSIIMTIIGVLNIFPTGLFMTYGLQIGSALEIFTLSMGLADRIAIMNKEKKKAQQEMLEFQEAMIETLRHSEQGLERKVRERTAELSDANEEIQRQMEIQTQQAWEIELANNALQEQNLEFEAMHKRAQRLLEEVNASIKYAERIQRAMLPSEARLNKILPDHFVFFQPRSVVSGDFYWCARGTGERYYVAAVDCTGHGVPGAFMSLIGNALLNEIVRRKPEAKPDEILKEMNIGVRRLLRQRETSNQDGMDMCLCAIDRLQGIVEYSGAKNPLYVWFEAVNGGAGRLEEYKATRLSVGGKERPDIHFELQTIDISAYAIGAVTLYLSTDGYKDQCNAARKKYLASRMKEQLAEISPNPLVECCVQLRDTFEAWRGEEEQMDDVLVVGVRI